ncbi:SDR family oxidoreductase [Kitasatospora sp. NPDC048365]|uniref:SDR family oxidoreductase n=1 Tax=Kitasatospora sp. NPDC048365 TaxID=3364050 RepID=UPI0037245B08
MTTLVTGGRGQIARAVTSRLHAAGLPVRAAGSRPAELAAPAGAETVELALGRPETFAAALRGVRQVFLYPEPAGIGALIEEAEAAGVEHVVLLSSSAVLGPEPEKDPLADHHLRVERALAGSALTGTFLRPDAFASNALGWAHPVSRAQPVQLPYPDAGVVPVHPEDIAEIAVEALTGDRLTGRALTLTGAEPLTFREQLAVLADVFGREIPVERITRDEAERQLSAFMPAPMVGSLLDFWQRADAEPVAVADTTATLLGRPARTFRRWAAEHADAFAPGRTAA